ncbi:hypothetical protein KOR42_08490 [Thalassoglobus neptunius]|uniref:Uncharacterized protein n=1 Tax=Thalassoglobus neptunius TaxID=1938619 RepID=A0A5C5X3V7_9PLAN|nr:hypothetical protein [Thalassoglobus neptunius]TWT57488.1 hypothetical protein KOR42_08490 [Thalassoglobus neptunius]
MYAICRSYNNPKLIGLLENLRNLPGIDGLIVPVNSDRDGDPSGNFGFSTRLCLEEASGFEDLKYLPIPERKYGWSKALNRALGHLPPREKCVLIVSTEVRLTPLQLSELQEAALSPSSSCGYALFRNRDEESYQFPRNTCLVWNLSGLKSGLPDGVTFNESLDSRNGMEDVELALRLFEQTGGFPMIGARDVVLEARTAGEEFSRKVAAESRAIKEIFKRFPPEVVERFCVHTKSQNRKRLM